MVLKKATPFLSEAKDFATAIYFLVLQKLSVLNNAGDKRFVPVYIICKWVKRSDNTTFLCPVHSFPGTIGQAIENLQFLGHFPHQLVTGIIIRKHIAALF